MNWVNIGWDNLQTKIAAAAAANTYFADAADVDWSKVGEYQKTGWFYPLNQYFSPAGLQSDMPQLKTFVSNGQLIGLPFDSSFLVTTVNQKDFAKAGITAMPTTLAGCDGRPEGGGHGQRHGQPARHPVRRRRGAVDLLVPDDGGVRRLGADRAGLPAFTSPSSPGYQALSWMVNAYKSGLVPAANINTTDYQGFTTEVAKNRVAAAMCDYSGSVASIYNVPSSSSVVNDVEYIPTPGAAGAGQNVANPDGIGIPKTAQERGRRGEVHQVVHRDREPGAVGRAEGVGDVVSTFPMPARLSSFDLMIKANDVEQAAPLDAILKAHAQAPFPNGAPPWYVQFSAAVQTNIHEAAAGQETSRRPSARSPPRSARSRRPAEAEL